MDEDPYIAIAGHLPNEVGVGGALITMVEPHVGFEDAYNRWYEDDHFYAGAVVGPWVFAGRRWVATRALQELRYPADSPIARPLNAGCYISVYWHSAGHHDDATRWGQHAMGDHLYPAGRGFVERTHVYTSFNTCEFSVLRDPELPLRPQHALNHPFAGLVVEAIDPGSDAQREPLTRWLEEEFVPEAISGSAAALCMGFHPTPLGPSHVPGVPNAPNQGRLVTLLWFLDADPQDVWDGFRGHGDAIAKGGLGELQLAAPFIPTIPGTNAYVDQLR